MDERTLMVVLHDVAPETWAEYAPFVAAMDALDVQLNLLVVPNFHGRNRWYQHPEFVSAMEQRLARGDELILHGFYHADDAPHPRTAQDWFVRRVYTHEGEFYQLDERRALQRIEAGVEAFDEQGWPVHGFVAPAWLMSAGTRTALSQTTLSYTSTPQWLYRLPDFQAISAPGLVWSAGSAWRRGFSWALSESQLLGKSSAKSWRLGLHPVDMRHEFSAMYWQRLVVRLLEKGFHPCTKNEWVAQQFHATNQAVSV